MNETVREGATRGSGQGWFERYGGSAPENYQRFFVPAIAAPLAADLLVTAALRPGERVLDLACGTGEVTRLAKQRVADGKVAGLDVNPGMLAVARAVTPPERAIEWHQADAAQLPFPEASFDVALCQLGLQFFSDRPAALREVRRVLVPGGRVIFTVVGPTPPVFAAMAEGLARHVGEKAAAFVPVVFSLFDGSAIRRQAEDAGLVEVRVEKKATRLHLPPPEEFLWQYVQSTPLAAAVAQASAESRAALERDVVRAWQPFTEDGHLVCALDVVTCSATAGR